MLQLISRQTSQAPPKTHREQISWQVTDKHGFSPLSLAVCKNDSYAVRRLVLAGSDIHAQSLFTLSDSQLIFANPLGISIIYKAMLAFHTLLLLGADPKYQYTTGKRPIHLAAQFGYLELLQLLIEMDVPPPSQSSNSLFQFYLVHEDFEASISSDDDDDGEIPDHDERDQHSSGSDDVSQNQEPSLIDVPQESTPQSPNIWSEPRAVMPLRDNDNYSDHPRTEDNPFNVHDIFHFEREVVPTGIEIRRDHSGNLTARLRRLLQRSQMQTARKNKDFGANLLHVATKYKQYEIVKFLINSSRPLQSVNDRRGDGMTALHIAAGNDDVKIMQLLLDQGNADVNIRNDVLGLCPIHIACENGAANALGFLLKHGAMVNTRDDNRFVPLHYSATSDANDEPTSCVDILIRAGADVNALANDGETPSYTAISRWNLPIFWKLMEAGANPGIPHSDGTVVIGYIAAKSNSELIKFADFVGNNPKMKESVDLDVVIDDEGQTALHVAVKNLSAEAVESLLKAGASPTTADDNGKSPLLTAIQERGSDKIPLLRIMTSLIMAGADINQADPNGVRPLHFACRHDLQEVVKLLLDSGVDINSTENYKTALHVAAEAQNEKCMSILMAYGANPNLLDDNSLTPALVCAKGNFVEGLAVLIADDADLSKASASGDTCLHICGQIRSPAVSRTIHILKNAGIALNVMNNDGYSPLHVHIRKKRTDGVRALIQAGCDVNGLSKGDKTPLMTACDKGHLEAVRMLILAGADVNIESSSKHTALFHFADTETSTIRTLRLLLAADAVINHKDQDGDTVLHEAALGNNPTIIRFLIHHNIDVNIRNNVGETALFQAARNGFSDTAEALLHDYPTVKGADPKIANNEGTTPYQIARSEEHSEVMQLLLQAMKVTLSSFAPLSTFSIASPVTSASVTMATESSNPSGRTICAVCQDELHFGEEVRRLPCGHEFHDPCILPWIGGEQMSHNRSCPVCKQPVAPTNL